jgi:hypothetical protein
MELKALATATKNALNIYFFFIVSVQKVGKILHYSEYGLEPELFIKQQTVMR